MTGMSGPTSPWAATCQERARVRPAASRPTRRTNMPLRFSPQRIARVAARMSGARGVSEGNARTRTSHAATFSTRWRTSGRVPAPSHAVRSSGQIAGSSARSGASTSEKQIGRSGVTPGGPTVTRRESSRPKPMRVSPSRRSAIGLPAQLAMARITLGPIAKRGLGAMPATTSSTCASPSASTRAAATVRAGALEAPASANTPDRFASPSSAPIPVTKPTASARST